MVERPEMVADSLFRNINAVGNWSTESGQGGADAGVRMGFVLRDLLTRVDTDCGRIDPYG